MTTQIRLFRVSCDHTCAKYQLHNELIEVRQANGAWYWRHAKYGSSKNYSAPELAIDGMLRDHACRLIRITPAERETPMNWLDLTRDAVKQAGRHHVPMIDTATEITQSGASLAGTCRDEIRRPSHQTAGKSNRLSS